MMRTIILCLLFTQSLFAQDANIEKNTSSNLADFHGVNVRGNIELILVASSANSISIEPGEDHRIDFAVVNNILKVKHRELFKFRSYEDWPIKITVQYSDLRKIKALAGAHISANESISGIRCDLDFGSGATGNLDLQVDKTDIRVGEGAELEVSGRVKRMTGLAATGGALEAFDLDCEDAAFKATTGGEACVTAHESMDAKANTGGCIIYKGDPEQVVITDNLGGTVMGKGM